MATFQATRCEVSNAHLDYKYHFNIFQHKNNNNSQYIYLKVPRVRDISHKEMTLKKLEKAIVILKDFLNDLKNLISMKAVK